MALSRVVSISTGKGATSNLEVFAIAEDGTVYHSFLNSKGTWDTWAANPWGAPKAKSITMAVGPTSNLEVFLIDSQGKAFRNHLDQSGKWYAWDAM